MTPEKTSDNPHPPVESPPAAGEKEPTPRKAFKHEIYRAWCKKCGLCAAFCPRGVIELDDTGAPVIAHPERCTGCGWCELHCPDFAIAVRERPQETSAEEGI